MSATVDTDGVELGPHPKIVYEYGTANFISDLLQQKIIFSYKDLHYYRKGELCGLFIDRDEIYHIYHVLYDRMTQLDPANKVAKVPFVKEINRDHSEVLSYVRFNLRGVLHKCYFLRGDLFENGSVRLEHECPITCREYFEECHEASIKLPKRAPVAAASSSTRYSSFIRASVISLNRSGGSIILEYRLDALDVRRQVNLNELTMIDGTRIEYSRAEGETDLETVRLPNLIFVSERVKPILRRSINGYKDPTSEWYLYFDESEVTLPSVLSQV